MSLRGDVLGGYLLERGPKITHVMPGRGGIRSDGPHKYPILVRKTRVLFRDFAREWESKYLIRVRASSAGRYRTWLTHQLLPAFGDRVLSGISEAIVETWLSEVMRSGQLAPKTVNGAIALLKQMIATAVAWGYLPSSPLTKVRKLRLPRKEVRLWTPAELRRFLLAAPDAWRPVWIVAVFTGLRPGELQAMAWTDRNWPDFTGNKLHVTCGYEAKSKVLGAPKTDRSVRDVDLVPTARQVLEALPSRATGGLVFPRSDGRMFSRSAMDDAWHRTIKTTKVRPIRPYDL